MIKFLDIFRQDKNIFKDNIKDITQIIKKHDFINGKYVVFEKIFLNFVKQNMLSAVIVELMHFFLH